MKFKIKILDIKNENKGKYSILTIDYKDLAQEKTSTKKVVSFGHPEVFDTLSKAQRDWYFEVTAEKGEKYWDWVAVSKTDESSSGATMQPTQAYTTPKSNYETPEERQKKQLYIIRQSCLSNAVSTLTNNVDPVNVKLTAQEYIDFVINGLENTSEFTEDDEIPY